MNMDSKPLQGVRAGRVAARGVIARTGDSQGLNAAVLGKGMMVSSIGHLCRED